ncbi:MAG TPA: TlpA family protein disulfide reductase, partial [Epsilonproteobacteria bacterium]|nr:TlpA family protein disulfide reductase [Campylobacterota bacterium]
MMKRVSFFFLLFLLLFLGACSKKSETEEQIPPSSTAPAIDLPVKTAAPYVNMAPKMPIDPLPAHFLLTNAEGEELNVTLDHDKVTLSAIHKPLVMINLFATWCPPCRAEIPYLTQLQKKHKKELAIIGVLVNDEQNDTQLHTFLKKNKINYFIANAQGNDTLTKQIAKRLGLLENFPNPLSVLYKDGKLYRYYEGAMPIEMMENEI